MKNSEAIEAIKNLDEQMRDLREQRNDFVQEWINQNHPVKIGETVNCNNYSYRGKSMVVDMRGVHEGFKRHEWTAKGPVLKKDGTPGKNIGEWSQKMEVE